jgi:O-antigen ligase
MKKNILNIVFVIHLIFFGLLVTGYISRSLVLYETIAIALYLVLASLEDGLVFFVRCIPLFVAIPLTATFDNFNQWRIFSIIIFAKWLLERSTWEYLISEIKFAVQKPWQSVKKHPVSVLFKLLGLLALLSVLVAPDKAVALKRIIYFFNASLIGIVIWDYARTKEFVGRIIKNIAIPTIVVALVGVIQVASTYFMDIYQFVSVWGEGIQLRQFGAQWSYIATNVGNTWFAYFGDQLSLRVFSLFPDSHSFPIFLLLGLPALFAISVIKPFEQADKIKKMLLTRGSLNILWIPLAFLMIILTGTRGMWLAGIGAIVWCNLLRLFLKFKNEPKEKQNILAYFASFLIIFILLFAVAYPIFSSPQFLVSKPDALLLQNRLRSVLDFGEMSNAARIAIWEASAHSIIQHPMLGVGIGNFPVILGQNVLLARAGSSAHNLYIHIAAEMGIVAFLASIYILWLIIRALYDNFIKAKTPFDQAYTGAILITLPWIFAYLMTDVAIFDERALLLFAVTLGLIFRE